MSKEKKIVELKDEELEKVTGGNGYIPEEITNYEILENIDTELYDFSYNGRKYYRDTMAKIGDALYLVYKSYSDDAVILVPSN